MSHHDSKEIMVQRVSELRNRRMQQLENAGKYTVRAIGTIYLHASKCRMVIWIAEDMKTMNMSSNPASTNDLDPMEVARRTAIRELSNL